LFFVMYIVKHDLSNACQSNCTYNNDKPNTMQNTWAKTKTKIKQQNININEMESKVTNKETHLEQNKKR
jgi:hypothetical protein